MQSILSPVIFLLGAVILLQYTGVIEGFFQETEPATPQPSRSYNLLKPQKYIYTIGNRFYFSGFRKDTFESTNVTPTTGGGSINDRTDKRV